MRFIMSQVRGGRPVQIPDPNRVRKLLGVWRGVGGGGGLGGSAGQPPGSLEGGSVGDPTYIPQHDPHDTLISLNIHKWVKFFFRKICPLAQAPISQGQTRRSGQGSELFLCFSDVFEFSRKF